MANNDNDVNDTSVQDTGTDASSTTDNNNSVEESTSSLMDAMRQDPELINDTNGDSEASDDEQTDETTASEDEQTEETEEEQSTDEDSEELSDEEMERLKGKTQTRIRGLAAENRALKEQVAALEGQRNVPHTVEDYVEAGYSEAQAEIAQMREERQVEKETVRVAQLNANMHEDSVNAEHDYPIFNEKSPDYDQDFAEAVGADYRRYANLQLDPTGQYIVRADIPMYDFYKSAAERYERGLSRGRTAGAKASAEQFASAEQAPSARPAPKSSKDTELDLLMKGLRSKLPG